MVSKAQAIIQGTYITLFILMSAGIAGEFDIGIDVPRINWSLYAIVSFLSIGKLIYLYKKGRI